MNKRRQSKRSYHIPQPLSYQSFPFPLYFRRMRTRRRPQQQQKLAGGDRPLSSPHQLISFARLALGTPPAGCLQKPAFILLSSCLCCHYQLTKNFHRLVLTDDVAAKWCRLDYGRCMINSIKLNIFHDSLVNLTFNFFSKIVLLKTGPGEGSRRPVRQVSLACSPEL